MNEHEAIARAKIAILKKKKKEPAELETQTSTVQAREFERLFSRGVGNEIDLTTARSVKQGAKWLVTFQYIIPPNIIILPSLIRVEIDDCTGQATILPSF